MERPCQDMVEAFPNELDISNNNLRQFISAFQLLIQTSDFHRRRVVRVIRQVRGGASVCLYVCPFVCLSVCLSVWVSALIRRILVFGPLSVCWGARSRQESLCRWAARVACWGLCLSSCGENDGREALVVLKILDSVFLQVYKNTHIYLLGGGAHVPSETLQRYENRSIPASMVC
jgi:hypothetical protein